MDIEILFKAIVIVIILLGFILEFKWEKSVTPTIYFLMVFIIIFIIDSLIK